MTKTNTFREHLQRAILETCDLWDIWSEWWGDMTWPKQKTMTKTKTKTMTNTFGEHIQRTILETCDLWDIWSEWWGDMTQPTKRQWERQIQTQRQWQRKIHWESTFRERPKRLVTYETFDQSDEKTWPDPTKDNDKHKHKDNDNDKDKYIRRAPWKSDPRDLWPLGYLIRVMRRIDLTKKKTNTNTKKRQWQRQIHLESTFKERC